MKKSSVGECRSKFAVAADTDQSMMKSCDAVPAIKPEFADRVSYAVAPDGHVVFACTSLNPDKHVRYTLNSTGHGGAQSVAKLQRSRRLAALGPPLRETTGAEHDPADGPLRQCAPAFDFDQRIAR